MKTEFLLNENRILLLLLFYSLLLLGCQPTRGNDTIDIQAENGNSEFFSGEKPETSFENQPVVQPTNPDVSSCPGAPPQRVKVGDRAVVSTQKDNLIIRESGFKSSMEITRIPPGTYFNIIGGPQCDEANNWSYWKIRTDGGVVGWVAEGGDNVDYYFFSPSE